MFFFSHFVDDGGVVMYDFRYNHECLSHTRDLQHRAITSGFLLPPSTFVPANEGGESRFRCTAIVNWIQNYLIKLIWNSFTGTNGTRCRHQIFKAPEQTLAAHRWKTLHKGVNHFNDMKLSCNIISFSLCLFCNDTDNIYALKQQSLSCLMWIFMVMIMKKSYCRQYIVVEEGM
jgi:hypothetical protein